jgi:hypothetical protein
MVSPWIFRESAKSGGLPDLVGRPHRRHLKGTSSKARINSLPRQPKPNRKQTGLKRRA